MKVSKEEDNLIGQRIEKIRKLKNIKQKDAAEYLEMRRENYTSREIRENSRYFKDFQILLLSKLFDVSSDYLLGLSNEPSKDIDIQNINKKYGLTKNSLFALEQLNDRNRNLGSQEINILNYLLEDVNVNKQNSLIKALCDYLYSSNTSTINFQIIRNGIRENMRTSEEALLLSDVTVKLNYLRENIIKEGEKE